MPGVPAGQQVTGVAGPQATGPTPNLVTGSALPGIPAGQPVTGSGGPGGVILQPGHTMPPPIPPSPDDPGNYQTVPPDTAHRFTPFEEATPPPPPLIPKDQDPQGE